MVFEKFSSDGFSVSDDGLINQYSCAGGSACCIIGSGRSLNAASLQALSVELTQNGITPFSLNWGGFSDNQWQCYPSLWTSYDACCRFSRHIFRNPSVAKFIPKARATEWIAGGVYTAQECPNTHFFDHEEKGIPNMFGSGKIIDCSDSFLQAVDLAIRLGFRTIYLAGCDFFVTLSENQIKLFEQWFDEMPVTEARPVKEKFIYADPHNNLLSTCTYLSTNGGRTVTSVARALEALDELELYSFGSAKTNWDRAISCDGHYYGSVNWLMQGRRCLDQLGVEVKLLDAYNSPLSRLRPFFEAVGLTTEQSKWYNGQTPDYAQTSLGMAKYLEPFTYERFKKKKEAK